MGSKCIIKNRPSMKEASKRSRDSAPIIYENLTVPTFLKEIAQNKKYFIRTYGCQANVRDEETMAGILEFAGFTKTTSEETADLIIINTCAVRENAEEKVYGEIGTLKKLKENNIRQLNEQREFRNDWEKTIRGFKDRLDDADAFKYDQEYYQQIYVNACNVVGISCTDNMRNLSDNGYNDFDVVIIDEVSKSSFLDLLIPILYGKTVILVGDHRQLPPM